MTTNGFSTHPGGFDPGELGRLNDLSGLDHSDDDDFDFEEEDLEPHEEVLDEWSELGWFDVLPSGLMMITSAFEDLVIPRIDFDEFAAEAARVGGVQLLDGDPMWPVLSVEQAAEDGITEPDEYASYLEGILQQRDEWTALVGREPKLAVRSLNELLELLIGWGLVRAENGLLELADEVPDPLELLPLDEEAITRVILDRMSPDLDAVQDVLHDFLHHSGNDELSTTLQKLANEAETSVDIVRLTLAMMTSDPESGLTADRFGPLTPDALEALKEHQKFTLRVDRSAPGFAAHDH